jgi:hypothetical protein
MSAYLTEEQVAQLLKQINPARVQQRDGMAHLEAYDVRAMLIRIFGFGRFSADLIDLAPLYEALSEDGKRVSTGYRATVKLTVNAPDGTVLATYTEAATGAATNFPITKRADAADFAIKTAESQALKRCATNLGDQFGLSLYRKGSTHALVVRTLVGSSVDAGAARAVDDGTPQIVPEHDPETSVGVASPSPAEEGAAPLPVSPEEGVSPSSADPPVDPEVAVGALRDQIIEILTLRNRREALQRLTRLQIQAGKDRLMEQPTHTPLGEPTTVAMLLDSTIKQLSRKESAA